MWFKIEFGRERRPIDVAPEYDYGKAEALRIAMDILREEKKIESVEQVLTMAEKLNDFTRSNTAFTR